MDKEAAARELSKRIEAATQDQPLTLPKLTECIKMVDLYSLVDHKLKLDTVKLDIKNENVAEYHDTCIKHGLVKLADQIVDFLSRKPLRASWSLDLQRAVIEGQKKLLVELGGTGQLPMHHNLMNPSKLHLARVYFGDFQANDIFWFIFPAQAKLADSKSDDKSGQSSPEAAKVKAHKSVLSNVSPVFESMFNKNWDKSEQVMDDSLLVDFDQPKIFQLFIYIIYELRKITTLSTEDAARVHFYIHKYQIEPLITEVRKVLTDRMKVGTDTKPYTVVELTESIKMADLNSSLDFKTKLNDVKLDIQDGNVAEIYDTCITHGMDRLVNQVDTFLDMKPLNKSWPLDLIVRYYERKLAQRDARIDRLEADNAQLRADNAQLRADNAQLRSQVAQLRADLDRIEALFRAGSVSNLKFLMFK